MTIKKRFAIYDVLHSSHYFHEHILIFVLNIKDWLCKFTKFKPTLKIEFYERLDKGVISLLFVLKPFCFLI